MANLSRALPRFKTKILFFLPTDPSVSPYAQHPTLRNVVVKPAKLSGPVLATKIRQPYPSTDWKLGHTTNHNKAHVVHTRILTSAFLDRANFWQVPLVEDSAWTLTRSCIDGFRLFPAVCFKWHISQGANGVVCNNPESNPINECDVKA